MKNIYVCLPCYNEQDNIGVLVDEWELQRDTVGDMDFHMNIVLIDDKSTDDTLDVMERCREKYDNVTILRHEINQNLGGGVKTAFHYFLENGKTGDLCCLMDGDNTHDPQYCAEMINKIQEGRDCVIASRYCNTSKVVGVPGIRLFLSEGARVFYSIVLRVKDVKDYTCGYRVYTYDIINKANAAYGERFIEMKTFACMMEILYKISLCGARFGEVAFELRYDNKQGESKMRILKTVKDSIFTALRLRFLRNNF